MRQLAHVLLALALLTPFAASQEDPLQLFKKVAANYTALLNASYEFEQIEVREYSGTMQNRTERRRRIVGSNGKYRDEALPSGPLYLFDGHYRWAYNPERKEYTKAGGTAILPAGLSMLEVATVRARSARLLRQETLAMPSGPVVCQVIEIEREQERDNRVQYSPMTYWIDPGRNLVLKLYYKVAVRTPERPVPSESAVTISFSNAVVGGRVDESLLRFTPPADAVQVQRLFFGPKSALAGTDSPDFELKGTDGKLISSANLRGRVVLLHFGASSDDDALFSLEMIHRSLKGNGLTAYYVSTSRDRGKPREAYTVPAAIDPDGNVAKKFGFSNAGMVVIDRSGKIVYGYRSSRNSLELVRALQAAGVW